MLTELRLQGFKCFDNQVTLPLRTLTLFTGINSKGKSSALQALLLIHQGVERATSQGGTFDRLELNGRYTRLGSFREVLHRNRPLSDGIHLILEFSEGRRVTETELTLRSEDDQRRWAELAVGEIRSYWGRRAARPVSFQKCLDLDSDAGKKSHLRSLERVHYISADRFGPQEFFTWSNLGKSQFQTVGMRGEQVAEVLFQTKQESVHERLVIEDAQQKAITTTVPDQAGAWLSYIFDGGNLNVGSPHESILTLEMNADGSSVFMRPINLGYGFSYLLPILIAGLVARPGDLLMVENPEAHLHPLAQSRAGEFLARVASTGVQVLVESHSEHILNAFRLAVRENMIESPDLSVLFFRRATIDPVLRVEVGDQGQIDSWPEGFFDQRTRDFLRLFGR